MTDVPSRLADRRCPKCDAVQPLYSAPRSGGVALQRGGQLVLPCPGCGAQLRLEDNPRDPGGIRAALIMIVGLCAAILGGIAAGTRLGLGETGIGLMVAGIVALGTGLAVWWNGMAARTRRVVVVEMDEKDAET